jgi:hypothetical protein
MGWHIKHYKNPDPPVGLVLSKISQLCDQKVSYSHHDQTKNVQILSNDKNS